MAARRYPPSSRGDPTRKILTGEQVDPSIINSRIIQLGSSDFPSEYQSALSLHSPRHTVIDTGDSDNQSPPDISAFTGP